eukprot:gene1781-1078_t
MYMARIHVFNAYRTAARLKAFFCGRFFHLSFHYYYFSCSAALLKTPNKTLFLFFFTLWDRINSFISLYLCGNLLVWKRSICGVDLRRWCFLCSFLLSVGSPFIAFSLFGGRVLILYFRFASSSSRGDLVLVCLFRSFVGLGGLLAFIFNSHSYRCLLPLIFWFRKAMKTSGGFFKDKATVGFNTLTGDKVDVALIKATSTELEAPREKYVLRLIDYVTHGNKGKFLKEGKPIEHYIISDLRKRTHSHNWVVVLKSYIVLHRLAMDGSLSFNQALKGTVVFDYMTIKNLEKTTQGARHKLFIMQYVSYLRARTNISTAADYGWRLEEERGDVELHAYTIDALLNAIDHYIEIPFREETVDNFASLEAYRLLIIDGKNLYRQLSIRILDMINKFHDESTASQRKYRQLYVRYDGAVEILKNFFDTLRASSLIFKEPIPSLKPLPNSVPQLLDEMMEAKRNSMGGSTTSVRSETPSMAASRRREEEDQRLLNVEEEILQKVLRESAAEAGVPYEDGNCSEKEKAKTEEEILQEVLRESAEEAGVPYEDGKGDPLPPGQSPPGPQKAQDGSTGQKKPSCMPQFTLEDLFENPQDAASPQRGSAASPYSTHTDPWAAASPGYTAGMGHSAPTADADGWETGAPAVPGVQTNTSFAVRGGSMPPASHPSENLGDWNSGAPTKINSGLFPSPAPPDPGFQASPMLQQGLGSTPPQNPGLYTSPMLAQQQGQAYNSPMHIQSQASSMLQQQGLGSTPPQNPGLYTSPMLVQQQGQAYNSPMHIQSQASSMLQQQGLGSTPPQNPGLYTSPMLVQQQGQAYNSPMHIQSQASSMLQQQGLGSTPPQNPGLYTSPMLAQQQGQAYNSPMHIQSQASPMLRQTTQAYASPNDVGGDTSKFHVTLLQQSSWDSGMPVGIPPGVEVVTSGNNGEALFMPVQAQGPAAPPPAIRRKNQKEDDPFLSLFEDAKKNSTSIHSRT